MTTADTRARHLFAAAGVLCCLLLHPFAIRCEGIGTVTLFPSERLGPFFARLRAEIQIAGFQVTDSPDGAAPNPARIAAALRTSSAVLFVREEQGTVALVYRAKDGRTARLEAPLPRRTEEEQLTALHIAEVLRVAFNHAERPRPPSPPRPAHGPRGRVVERLSARLCTAALFGDLGAPPQAGLQGALGIGVTPRLTASLNLDLPLFGVRLREPEGDARIYMGGVGLSLDIAAAAGFFRPVVRLGYHLWIFGASSSPAPGFDGAASVELTSGPMIHAGATVAVRGRLGITAGATAAVTTNAIDYGVTARPVATVGRPMLGILLGLVWLPARRDT